MAAAPKGELPILLLGTLGAIRSKSRLQKLAFLSDMELFKDAENYAWKAHNYGPFSTELEEDMEHYRGAGMIDITDVRHPVSEELVLSYSLTAKGRTEFYSICKDKIEKITEMRDRFFKYQFHDSNAMLFLYIYKNHKEYTANSIIPEQVTQ